RRRLVQPHRNLGEGCVGEVQDQDREGCRRDRGTDERSRNLIGMANENDAPHISVLLEETLRLLDLKPGDNVIDGTLGAGGHAEAILERTSPDGKLLGLDLDEAALDSARRRLSRFGSRAVLVHGNYKNVGAVLQ